jgi:hypothetical protein
MMFETLEDRSLFSTYTFGEFVIVVNDDRTSATITQSGTDNTATATGTVDAEAKTATGTVSGIWKGVSFSKTGTIRF